MTQRGVGGPDSIRVAKCQALHPVSDQLRLGVTTPDL